ncbi:MAG TPA: alpha/beta fold hydrolase [Solirubrobacterales bacterium]|nr:alpha/beta fold hydrolase [Solirubrobacterales bacterium]
MGALDPLEFLPWETQLHGHDVIYRKAGSGPAVVLIHGMVNSSRHWEEVALRLADDHAVIAPDLIGHGDSAAVRGDYSLGAHASSIRDLLATLGVERATIVGHSLGGGIAMQFFYQFPQRTERLVLVSSGGLGRDVSPLLRGAAAPGASALIWAAAHPRVLDALWDFGERMRERGRRGGVYPQAIARALRPLQRPGARQAFLQTLRSVIDARGQKVSARDRLYLLDWFPTLIVWGERDHTIPIAHGRAAHEAIAGSRFETLPRAAHFPHLEDPEGLAAAISDFVRTTGPGRLDDGDWGEVLKARPPRRRTKRSALEG